MNKKIIIMISSFLFAILVTLIDCVIKPNYFIKVPIKVIFFLILPIIFFIINKEYVKDFKKLFKFNSKGILKSLLLGLGCYIIILGLYFCLKNIIDFSRVTTSLTEGMGITANNFVFVALYISLMNSFLEEFFFRGYSFITLKKYSNRKVAYLFSSLIFAIYHIGMLIGMFNIGVLGLLLVGLIIGGFIFNYLNEVNDNIYSSWFVHMFCNFAINTIGFILFGVL